MGRGVRIVGVRAAAAVSAAVDIAEEARHLRQATGGPPGGVAAPQPRSAALIWGGPQLRSPPSGVLRSTDCTVLTWILTCID